MEDRTWDKFHNMDKAFPQIKKANEKLFKSLSNTFKWRLKAFKSRKNTENREQGGPRWRGGQTRREQHVEPEGCLGLSNTSFLNCCLRREFM